MLPNSSAVVFIISAHDPQRLADAIQVLREIYQKLTKWPHCHRETEIDRFTHTRICGSKAVSLPSSCRTFSTNTLRIPRFICREYPTIYEMIRHPKATKTRQTMRATKTETMREKECKNNKLGRNSLHLSSCVQVLDNFQDWA